VRAPVWAQLRGHPPPDKGPSHRGRIGLQLGQFSGKFRGQEVRHSRKHLRGLHQGPLQIAQRRTQGLGIAQIRIAAAKQAIDAIGGLSPRQANPDLGKTAQPPA